MSRKEWVYKFLKKPATLLMLPIGIAVLLWKLFGIIPPSSIYFVVLAVCYVLLILGYLGYYRGKNRTG